MTTTKHMSWRQRARALIAAALIGSEGETRKQVRARIRDAYDQYPHPRSGYPYQVWLQERRFALGERTRTQRMLHRAGLIDPDKIIPTTVPWATERGLVAPAAVLDVHLPLEGESSSPTPDHRSPSTDLFA